MACSHWPSASACRALAKADSAVWSASDPEPEDASSRRGGDTSAGIRATSVALCTASCGEVYSAGLGSLSGTMTREEDARDHHVQAPKTPSVVALTSRLAITAPFHRRCAALLAP